MLSLTDTARDALQEITERAGLPEEGGLRIAETTTPGSFELSLVIAPVDGDEVIDADGARVFLESTSADALTDHELDATPSPEGTGFLLAARTEPEADEEPTGHGADEGREGHGADEEPTGHGADEGREGLGWDEGREGLGWDEGREGHGADEEPTGHGADEGRERLSWDEVDEGRGVDEVSLAPFSDWDPFGLEPDGFDRLAFRAITEDDPEVESGR